MKKLPEKRYLNQRSSGLIRTCKHFLVLLVSNKPPVKQNPQDCAVCCSSSNSRLTIVICIMVSVWVGVVILGRILKQELMHIKNHKTNAGNLTLDSGEPQKRAKASLFGVVKMKASSRKWIYKEIRIYILNAERRSLNNLPSEPNVIPQGALTSMSKEVKALQGAAATNLSFRPRREDKWVLSENRKTWWAKQTEVHIEKPSPLEENGWLSHCLVWPPQIFNKRKYCLYISIFIAVKNNF